jgi:imidazolonepropionase-like amidohydrolase
MRFAAILALASAASLLGCPTTPRHSSPSLASPATSSRPTATLGIVGASVVHPARNDAAAVERDMTVLVSGDRIVAVGPTASTPVPAGARVVDARGMWIVPGLVDAHVHFFQSGNLYTRPDIVDLRGVVPYGAEVARNKARLSATFAVWLASGVTSVVDMGGPMWNFAIRDEAARSAAAPRVLVAGPLVSTIRDEVLELDDPPIVQMKSPDEARAEVRRQLGYRPDFIKIWFVHRPSKDDLATQEAMVRAAAEVAHAGGVRLAVHATKLAVAKAALRAGADILVHSVGDRAVDDEFIALARKNHAQYTPTLSVSMGYSAALSARWEPTEAEARLADPEILAHMNDFATMPADAVPASVREDIAARRPIEPRAEPMANLRRVWDAGIVVAVGTDAGNIGTLHGPSVFREMERMAQAGLSPREVLLAATVNGAEVMGLGRDLGDIAPGKLADLVILDADPIASVKALSHARYVVRAGRIFDPKELIAPLRSP